MKKIMLSLSVLLCAVSSYADGAFDAVVRTPGVLITLNPIAFPSETNATADGREMIGEFYAQLTPAEQNYLLHGLASYIATYQMSGGDIHAINQACGRKSSQLLLSITTVSLPFSIEKDTLFIRANLVADHSADFSVCKDVTILDESNENVGMAGEAKAMQAKISATKSDALARANR